MSQKNETPVLLLALLITAGLIGGGFWWFTRNGIGLGGSDRSETDNLSRGNDDPNSGSNQLPTQSNGENFDSVPNVPSGLFNYGGSTSWAPIRLAIDPAIQAARPEFRLRYVEPTGETPGSTTGIKMLLDDRLALLSLRAPFLTKS